MNLATIGTGFIVDRFLEASHDIESLTVSGMYSRSKETAAPLALKHSIAKIYTDLDELLADSSIDAIYIASPNSFHYKHAEKALQAGKHVLCEKPFTSNSKEAEALIQLAQEKKLILMEAITTIHLPNFKEISSSLKKIGKVRLVKCSYSQYSSRYDKLLAGEVTNVFNPEFSGGALMDINVYNLHFVLRLFGSPQSVAYMANKHSNGIDTSGIVLMKYPDFIAECTGSKDTAGYNAAFIQGEKGWLHVIDGVNGCIRIQIHTAEGIQSLDAGQHRNVMYEELSVFCRLIHKKEWPQVNDLLSHSSQVMKVLDEARRNADIVFPSDN